MCHLLPKSLVTKLKRVCRRARSAGLFRSRKAQNDHPTAEGGTNARDRPDSADGSRVHNQREDSLVLDDEDDRGVLNLAAGDVDLFAKLAKARRRKKALKYKLHQCEDTIDNQRQSLREGTRRMQQLMMCEELVPPAERWERLRLCKRVEIQDQENRETYHSYETHKQRHRKLGRMIEKHKGEYQADKDRLFENIENAFLEADLMIYEETDDGTNDSSDEAGPPLERVARHPQPASPALTVEELQDENEAPEDDDPPPTLRELDQMRREVEDYEYDLENRAYTYDEESRIRHEHIAAGRAQSFTTSIFDVEMLRHNMDLTRAYIEAENTYRAAKLHRQEAGCSIDENQESDFPNDPEDGFCSLEEIPDENIDRGKIHRWLDGLARGSAREMASPPTDATPNETRAGLSALSEFRFGEGMSGIAYESRQREKIRSWEAVAAEQRDSVLRVRIRRDGSGSAKGKGKGKGKQVVRDW